MKGCYLLLLELITSQKIQIGKLGILFFKKGFYVYIGSAMNNLESRVKRHLRSEKKLHWHIDYLLKHARIIDVYYKESSKKKECIVADNFKNLEKILGFGCSDCKCKSHLFYGAYKEINSILVKLDFSKYK
jgi:Uri superfamily endonuclease